MLSPAQRRNANNKSKSRESAVRGQSLKSKIKSSAVKSNRAPRSNAAKMGAKAEILVPRRRSRLVSPTPSKSDSISPDNSDNENESAAGDVGSSLDGNGSQLANLDTSFANGEYEDSPEPDFMLAEVTHDSESVEESPIPSGLVHRALHLLFSEPHNTKISIDSRMITGKYVEVFIREAVMRCAYEKRTDFRNAKGSDQSLGNGWLEVEDLEKVAVQLCLDF